MAYQAIATHDIDFVTKYKSFRNVLGAVRRKVKFSDAYQAYKLTKKDRTRDPYWSMLELLQENNKAGIRSQFYFKTAITNKRYDWNDYEISDLDIKELISELKNGGAEIGLHPSIECYNDGDQIKREKELLEVAAEQDIILSRQHFLRYQSPKTFELLAKAGIKIDSTLGPVNSVQVNKNNGRSFEIYNDGEISLIEQPFIMMETHLIANGEKMLQDLENVVTQIKKHKGTAVIIWHNNNYETVHQKDLYHKVLKTIS
ncbi:hypothetical protein N9B82_00115 [Saprospiraceae bacterium]|nr:hypothetical protein [Saprospiraceae bacterium]